VRRLRGEAADLAGELVLGHLCEAAQVAPLVPHSPILVYLQQHLWEAGPRDGLFVAAVAISMLQMCYTRRVVLHLEWSCCVVLLNKQTPTSEACLPALHSTRQWPEANLAKRGLFVAQDILTEMNSPDGACPICLLRFAGAGGSPQGSPEAADQPIKLQCYHCMHR